MIPMISPSPKTRHYANFGSKGEKLACDWNKKCPTKDGRGHAPVAFGPPPATEASQRCQLLSLEKKVPLTPVDAKQHYVRPVAARLISILFHAYSEGRTEDTP